MSEAILKILGIRVPLGPFDGFYDDGFVKSLNDYSLFLDSFYESNNAGDEPDKEVRGRYAVYNTPLKRNYHIYYLKSDFEPLDMMVRAHEETHALDGLGRLDLLSEKMLREQRVRADFLEIEDKEIIAGLGSIYAMFAHNIQDEFLKAGPFNENFRAARELYKKLKI